MVVSGITINFISKRPVKNVYSEGELDEKVVCAKFAHTTLLRALKGKTQESMSKYYNLDVIISVGYQVNLNMAKQFRIWAKQRLKDYFCEYRISS